MTALLNPNVEVQILVLHISCDKAELPSYDDDGGGDDDLGYRKVVVVLL